MYVSPADEIVRSQIDAAYREYGDALARHDAVALASFYENDAVVLAPGAAPVCGAHGIRAYCEGICALPYDFEISGFTIEHAIVLGDLVIESSRYSIVNVSAGDPSAAVVKRESKNLMVWRRRDGKWRIAREMYSDIKT